MSLLGDIGELKIGDVLRVFASGKKTGVLTVAAGSSQAVLLFQKGAIVHAACGRLQGDDAVIDVFGWKQGQLTFVPEERKAIPNVSRAVDALIDEGVRVGDTFHRMHEVIPSDRAVFQMGPGPADAASRVSVGAAEWKVLRALDGVRDVREVAEAARLPRPEVTRILFTLVDAGFLERVDPQRSLRVQAQGLFGRETADVDARLETEWRRVLRFQSGVHRVELRTLGGKTLQLGVQFRTGLIRDIHLPRTALATLAVGEGDDVSVRPIG
jgi:hypothetical protein